MALAYFALAFASYILGTKKKGKDWERQGKERKGMGICCDPK